MPFHRFHADPLGQGLIWVTCLVFGVAAVFGIFLFYLTLVGPSEVERARSWEVDESEVIEWMEQSIEAQEAFKRDWLADPEDPEVFANLEAALGFQRKLKAIDPDDAFGSSARLSELMQLLKATKGQSLYTEGRINGEKAVELVARGDSISAIPLLEKALSNQEWINANLRDSSLVDLGEVARLRQWLASLETVDAVAEVDRYYEEGKVAYAAKDWDLGEVLFDRAISIQESINLNMPESSHVRWRLIQELKDYQRRIDAGRMNQRVEELISASKREDPSDNLERAMNLQSLLNERYSATEYLNPERLEFLKSELATDLSEANSGLLIEQSERLTQLIRKKDWPGAQVALLELEGVILEFIHLGLILRSLLRLLYFRL